MSKNNKELTVRGQVLIELACIGGALLLWLCLLMLGGLTEVFFYILIGYHVIGGLINRDIAKSMRGAIILAPIYVGRKIAIYIQYAYVEGRFKELTTKNLIELNRVISNILAEHPNQMNETTNPMFGCATYGELAKFNERIVQEYNKRSK